MNIHEHASMHIVILRTAWYQDVINGLEAEARAVLFAEDPAIKVETFSCPGSFELPLLAQWAISSRAPQALIALGAIITGETEHAQHIARTCADALMQIQLSSNRPIGFGVLTTATLEAARRRSLPESKMNKGAQAASAVLSMLSLSNAHLKNEAVPV